MSQAVHPELPEYMAQLLFNLQGDELKRDRRTET